MKAAQFGVAIVLCSTVLMACQSNPPPTVASASGRVPTQADIDSCNSSARDQTGTGSSEVLKDAAIGGVGGAAVGAAGGAIADGGSGAGKGAAVGGLVGATAGTLYGLNERNKGQAAYESAYRSCMAQRGY